MMNLKNPMETVMDSGAVMNPGAVVSLVVMVKLETLVDFALVKRETPWRQEFATSFHLEVGLVRSGARRNTKRPIQAFHG